MRRNSPLVGEERRGLALAEARASISAESGVGKRFQGYASVFNSRTAIGNPRTWGFYEQISPGAYTKTIDERDQGFLVNHDSTLVVSRRSAGTLALTQDERGLLTDSALDEELSYVRDLRVNLRNGNISGMSFGFSVPDGKDDWTVERMLTEDGLTVEVEVRTIREIKLYEVSAVTFPAYEETTAGLRHSLVPALLHRGDAEAIRRAATHRPDLAALLGYEPDLAPTVIDIKPISDAVAGDIARAMRKPLLETKSAPMNEPGAPTQATPAEVQASTEEFFEVKGWTNSDAAEEAAETNSAEPVASTRHAPSQHDLAKVRLLELYARMHRPAA